MESDAEEHDREGTNCQAEKKSTKKQGGRDVGQKKKNGRKTDTQLTNAIQTPPMSLMGKVYYPNICAPVEYR